MPTAKDSLEFLIRAGRLNVRRIYEQVEVNKKRFRRKVDKEKARLRKLRKFDLTRMGFKP